MRLIRLLGPYVVWFYPIGVLVLLYYLRSWLVAGRDLRGSLFTLERETAVTRMHRAARGAFTVFALLIGLFFVQFYLGRSFDIANFVKPTPTPAFIPKVVFNATATPTAQTPQAQPTTSVTATRRPTVPPVTVTPAATATAAPATAAPPVAAAHCSDPGVQIMQPGQGARVQGRVEIRGTANIPNFQFYKIELGLGDRPAAWTSIADVRRSPVVNGLLEVWDTSGLPAGTYSLRLVVVDMTGNFKPPCEVQVVVVH